MLVLVVGPSGAGKDTLLNAARAALASSPGFVFPRRVVTRQAVAALEDHDSVSEAEFAAASAAGAYALSWSAHGLSYGLPARLIDDLKAGRTVVFNSSRAMVAEAQAKFPGTRVVLVEATPEAAGGLVGLRDAIESGAAGAVVAGACAPRLPNTTCLVLPGVAAETPVIALDIAGIRVSAGAACSSGKVARSPVLQAMGFGEDAGCGIRVSLPWNAPADAVERFLAAWAAMRDRLSRRAA